MTFLQIQEKINKNNPVDFGDVFGEAINLFQKVWLQGFLLLVLSFLIQYGLSLLMYIPAIALEFIVDDQALEGDFNIVAILVMILFLVLYLVTLIVVTTFNFGLQAAFYRIVRVKERNKRAELGINFGMFFKKKHIKKLFIFSMAQAGIGILAFMLCVIPILYVFIPLQFALIIFAFHPDLTINEIYKAAFNLGNAKWGVTFGLVFVSGILASIVGLVACFIGIYFTLSFVYLPAYLVYKRVVGFYEDDDAIAQIGA
ncbi:hypothetical protein ACFO3O_13050 [Dokdonia ponticola]|uniref:Glycerophosphoryl diester phosphodiesterase membrane domain-containing protein n=1 Tax=Dokdonia ponticola TaxID=2041041 RepID=A0ABV9HYB6_9FLAO